MNTYLERGEQAAHVYTAEYLCSASVGTPPCALNIYTQNDLEICEGLYCEDPDDSDSCIHAGFIPPHGMSDCYRRSIIIP